MLWAPLVKAKKQKRRIVALLSVAFSDVIKGVGVSLSPHHICTYLCELAGGFHKFYESCSISKAESDQIKNSRVILSYIVSQVLKLGLELLGISVIDVM